MTIELTEEQAQRAVNLLAQLPYIQVADIVDKIKEAALPCPEE